MNKLLKVSLALDVLLCKGFVLKRATLLRICWLWLDFQLSDGPSDVLDYSDRGRKMKHWLLSDRLTWSVPKSRNFDFQTGFRPVFDHYHMRTQGFLLLPDSSHLGRYVCVTRLYWTVCVWSRTEPSHTDTLLLANLTPDVMSEVQNGANLEGLEQSKQDDPKRGLEPASSF